MSMFGFKQVKLSLYDTLVPVVFRAAGKELKNVNGVPVDVITTPGVYNYYYGVWEQVEEEEYPSNEEPFFVFEYLTNIIGQHKDWFLGEPEILSADRILRKDILVTAPHSDVIRLEGWAYPIYDAAGNDTGERKLLDIYPA